MRHRVCARLRPVALFLVVWVTNSVAAEFAGNVVGVTDGDMLTVLRERAPVRVRLHGFDAPEAG